MNHVPVAIIGAGPAGLTLAHLLHLQGVESIVFESRTRKDVEETVRAGILEQGTLNLMRETGVGARMEAEADHDEAIDISINNERTRIPLTELTGHKVAIYPQHEYLKDFIAKRIEDGGELLFTTTVDSVENYEGDLAKVTYTEADGSSTTITADYVIAADGSNSPYRKLITEDGGVRARHEYPYAWFGILVEAPKTQKELIYATHPEGFALISTRTDEIQRYYLQCNPDDTPDMWPDDRIWEQLHLRADSLASPCLKGASLTRPCCVSAPRSPNQCKRDASSLLAMLHTPCRQPELRASTWLLPMSQYSRQHWFVP